MSGTSCSRKYAKHEVSSGTQSSGDGGCIMFGLLLLAVGVFVVLAASGVFH